jgi:hypothetical protein
MDWISPQSIPNLHVECGSLTAKQALLQVFSQHYRHLALLLALISDAG